VYAVPDLVIFDELDLLFDLGQEEVRPVTQYLFTR
jgi:hypothetical protein